MWLVKVPKHIYNLVANERNLEEQKEIGKLTVTSDKISINFHKELFQEEGAIDFDLLTKF